VLLRSGAGNSGEPLQGAGISGKLRESEQKIESKDLPTVGDVPMHETLQGSGSCGISVQGVSKSKPVHLVTSVVKRFQLARPKLFGAAMQKLEKSRVFQNDSRALVQPGQDTSPCQVGPNRSRPEGCTSMGQPPKKPRALVEHESCREALVSFKIAVLLYHPEDRLSEEDQSLVLKEIGRVFYETPNGECPHLLSYRLEEHVLFYVCRLADWGLKHVQLREGTKLKAVDAPPNLRPASQNGPLDFGLDISRFGGAVAVGQ
jgi:hypothetical protein